MALASRVAGGRESFVFSMHYGAAPQHTKKYRAIGSKPAMCKAHNSVAFGAMVFNPFMV